MESDRFLRKWMNLLFIINPVSGGIDKSHLPALFHDFSSRENFDYRVYETQPEITDSPFSKPAISGFSPDVIVAVGGDGTVNYAGKIAMTSGLPLAIIPLGTSNALAKNLGIPLDIHAALRRISDYAQDRTHTWEIDTLEVNGLACLHICDIGINAKLVRRYHKWKKRGKLYYFMSLLAELFPRRFFKYRILVRSASEDTGNPVQPAIDGKAFSMTITNARMYGTGAVINPQGKMDDGKFEICIIEPFPFWKMLQITMRLFRNRIHLSKYCRFLSLSSAVIQNLSDEAVHIDGEPVDLDSEIRIQMKERSLRVIV